MSGRPIAEPKLTRRGLFRRLLRRRSAEDAPRSLSDTPASLTRHDKRNVTRFLERIAANRRNDDS